MFAQSEGGRSCPADRPSLPVLPPGASPTLTAPPGPVRVSEATSHGQPGPTIPSWALAHSRGKSRYLEVDYPLLPKKRELSSFSPCVTFNEVLSLPGPQFPHYYDRIEFMVPKYGN